MKFIYLLWENLVLYYRKNRLIFFLYCLCGVISTVAVLYFYGNMVPMVYNRNSTELYYREYRLISGGARSRRTSCAPCRTRRRSRA